MAPPEQQRLDYPIGADGLVIDVGGYQGDFSRAAIQKWKCRVVVFEPLASFIGPFEAEFGDRCEVHCCGLGSRHRWERISIRNDSSSVFSPADGEACDILIRDVVEVFQKEIGAAPVDLMTINCEGGEYELLERMIDTGLILRVRYLQVQWHGGSRGHGDGPADADVRRDQITRGLEMTHRLQWDWPSVTWQSWERL